MSRRSPADVATRRRILVNLLAGNDGLTIADLQAQLPGRIARRTLHEDLAFFRASFGNQLRRTAAGAGRSGRITYAWHGPVPRILPHPLTWLSEGELLALVAARGLLHIDDQSIPATRGTARALTGLANEVHRLIQRTGMADPAQGLGRHIVTVSRFGAAPIASDVLTACLTATATNQAITFTYTNLAGETSSRHAAPQRMVLIRGEWYCIAWARFLRMFRLARMVDVRLTTRFPEQMPAHLPSQAVDDLLALSFFATGSAEPARRRRVVVAVSPGAWPFVQGRSWGIQQQIDETPADLPPGWRRLRFTTTGLDECRHWILSMGTGLRAEKPAELVDWLRSETQALSAAYQAPA